MSFKWCQIIILPRMPNYLPAQNTHIPWVSPEFNEQIGGNWLLKKSSIADLNFMVDLCDKN